VAVFDFSRASKGWGVIGFLLPLIVLSVAKGLGLEDMMALRVALGSSAAAIWFLGRYLNRGSRGVLATLLSKKAEHSLFGIPLHWFSVVLLLFLAATFLSPLGAES
jgi:hypothetical protein